MLIGGHFHGEVFCKKHLPTVYTPIDVSSTEDLAWNYTCVECGEFLYDSAPGEYEALENQT